MDFKSTVLPILRSTRSITLPHWGKAKVMSNKGTRAHDVVTELDIAVEEQVKKELTELYPNIAFVGEEGGGDRDAQKLWLMDPIDGTAHFVRGLPFTTTMLAYIENGIVQCSAVYDFVRDDMYWAERGKGAYCNDTKISVSERRLKDAYVGWETHLDIPENSQRFKKLRKQTMIFSTISAGWEYAMVASGKLDGRVCFDPHGKDYDFAPGSLLVEEAGGVVRNIGKETYDYRNRDFIAANPIIYKELTQAGGVFAA
jgi:myo-inositol-1(or 4)-monophosphatase